MKKLFLNLKIGQKIIIQVIFFFICFICFGILAYNTLNHVKVNGPIYVRIVQGKDLIADILPPPEYIIESYLVVNLMANMTNLAEIESMIVYGEKLEKEYLSRHSVWVKGLEEGEIRELMVVKAYDAAMEFYRIRDGEYYAAIRSGDNRSVRQILMGPLKDAYTRHRECIDRIVIIANERNSVDETKAAELILSQTILLISVGVGMGVLIALFSLFIVRVIGRVLRGVIVALTDIAQGEGDLTRRIDAPTRDETGELAKWFNEFISKMQNSIATVKHNAEQISDIIETVFRSAQGLSLSSNEQASGTEEITTTLEEFTMSLTSLRNSIVNQNKEITRMMIRIQDVNLGVAAVLKNAQNLRLHGEASVDMVKKGNSILLKAMEKTMEYEANTRKISEQVLEIEAHSENIDSILRVIEDIAEQTNILSMNAAIEASHAGSYGQSFSIVADEIRQLSTNTSNSVGEIAQTIRQMKQGISESVSYTRKSEELAKEQNESNEQVSLEFQAILHNIEKTSDSIQEIFAVLDEQSVAVQNVFTGFESLKTVSNDITFAIEEETKAAEQIKQSMELLSNETAATTQTADSLSELATHLKTNRDSLMKVVGSFKISE